MEDMWEAGRDASGAMEAGVQARAGKRIDLVHGTARGIISDRTSGQRQFRLKKKISCWTKVQSRGMADHTQHVSS
jgi:hypothetical protein